MEVSEAEAGGRASRLAVLVRLSRRGRWCYGQVEDTILTAEIRM